MSEVKYVHTENGFEKREYTAPKAIGDHEIHVKPLRALICASDFHHMLSNPTQEIVLGHEWVGRVIRASPNSTVKEGQLVTSTACLHCGDCEQCRSGHTNYCDNKSWLGFEENGALSTLLVLSDHHVVTLPNDLTLRQAALFEVASVGFESVRLLSECGKIEGGKVLVMGAGPVGIFCALAAKKKGLDVTLLDKLPKRVKLASDLGFNCLHTSQILTSKDFHHHFSHLIDATGDAHGKGALNYILLLGKPRFNLVVVGKYFKDPGLPFTTLNNYGATLKFMRGTPLSSLQSVVREWKEDIVEMEPLLISHQFQLEETAMAYKTAKSPESCFKILISIQD